MTRPALVVVREARRGELRAAGEVVAEAYARLPGARHDAYLEHVRDAEGRARDCPILVAVAADGRVVGSVTYVPGAGNPYSELEVEGEAGFRMLGVSPDAQGLGIGERLVAACLDRARRDGRAAVAIASAPVMTSAHRLYGRMGFRRAPDRDFDPVPGVHLLAFLRDLAAPSPRPASTVALLRPGPAGPEVLLTHRPDTMEFGPGLHVFPGGAIDPGDGDARIVSRSALGPAACAAAWGGDLGPREAVAHHVAALRELFEEVGILLADGTGGRPPDPGVVAAARREGLAFGDLVMRLDLRLRTDRLVPLSRWVTPPVGLPRRYDARFFVAWLPDGGGIELDEREVAGHDWMRPDDALAAMAAGRIRLWTPTGTTLQQLATVRDEGEVRERLAPVGPAPAPVTDRVRADIVRVRLGGAGGIPGRQVNAYLVGRERVVVVDPGDPNDDGVDAILAAADEGGGRITAVLLTAPLPDHAAGAACVAARVGAPILAAPGAAAVLADPVEPLAEGDLPDIADTRIRVLATPGPHPGHLVFDLPDAGALLTGDLAPSTGCRWGTRDEVALRASAERIGALGPRRQLPAHGPETG